VAVAVAVAVVYHDVEDDHRMAEVAAVYGMVVLHTRVVYDMAV
jgi:hypothetical protein